MQSFENILKTLKPQVCVLQETKLKPREKIVGFFDDKYQIYYLNRKEKCGGGVAIGVEKGIESTLVNEGNDETECLVVKIEVKDIRIKIIGGYGPQENASKDKKEAFWNFLDEEVMVLIQMDGNLLYMQEGEL